MKWNWDVVLSVILAGAIAAFGTGIASSGRC